MKNWLKSRKTGFAAKIGLSPISGRIVTSEQGRRMLGHLAGLRSVQKQRAAGWPNLRKATAMRQLHCRFRRCVWDAGLSADECQAAWHMLMYMRPEQALGLDMMGWMARFKPQPQPPPVDLQAEMARQLLLKIIRSRRESRVAAPRAG